MRQSFGDGVIVVLVFLGMTGADGAGFVMYVPVRAVRMDDELLHVFRIEFEDAGFAMIEPDDGVKMVHDGFPSVRLHPKRSWPSAP